MQITLLATIFAKPTAADRLGELLLQLAAASRAEPGCINYDVHQSTRDPSQWIVYENWQSQQALDSHASADHYKQFGRATQDLLARPADLHVLEMKTTQESR